MAKVPATTSTSEDQDLNELHDASKCQSWGNVVTDAERSENIMLPRTSSIRSWCKCGRLIVDMDMAVRTMLGKGMSAPDVSKLVQ